jgi:hypothetical protein
VSPRPQVTVSQIDTPPPVSIDTDTGKWFVRPHRARTARPDEIRNMTQFVDKFGDGSPTASATTRARRSSARAAPG